MGEPQRDPGVPRSLRVNVSWTVLSNIVYGIYQFALLAVLAKLSGAVAVGEFSLALGLVMPVQMFFNLQLRGLQASDVRGAYPFTSYLLVRLAGIAATAAFVTLLLVCNVVPSNLTGPVVGVLCVKSLESLSDIVYGHLQRYERLDLIAKSRILESGVGLLLFTISYAANNSILASMLTVLGGLVAILLCYTWRTLQIVAPLRQEDFVIHRGMSSFRGIAIMGLPLGVTMALVYVNTSVPRFFLERYSSTLEVGVFAGFTQLVSSGVIVIGAIGQAVTPRFAQHLERGRIDEFQLMVRRLVMMGLGLGIGGAVTAYLVGGPIVEVVYSSAYGEYRGALVILSVSAAFSFAASFQGYALTAARILNAQVVILSAAVLTTVFTLWLLAPAWGIEGAAWATVASALVQFLLSWWFLLRRTNGLTAALAAR